MMPCHPGSLWDSRQAAMTALTKEIAGPSSSQLQQIPLTVASSAAAAGNSRLHRSPITPDSAVEEPSMTGGREGRQEGSGHVIGVRSPAVWTLALLVAISASPSCRRRRPAPAAGPRFLTWTAPAPGARNDAAAHGSRPQPDSDAEMWLSDRRGCASICVQRDIQEGYEGNHIVRCKTKSLL